jgi:hypothetical protein
VDLVKTHREAIFALARQLYVRGSLTGVPAWARAPIKCKEALRVLRSLGCVPGRLL